MAWVLDECDNPFKVIVYEQFDPAIQFPKLKPAVHDSLALIIDYVMTRSSHTFVTNNRSPVAWIYADEFYSVAPQNRVAEFTNLLDEAEVIHKSDGYLVGSHPKKYWIRSNLLTGCKLWPITTGVARKKLRAVRQLDEHHRYEKLPKEIHRKLANDLSRLTFDESGLELSLSSMEPLERHHASFAYLRLKQGRYFASVDPFGCRLHTNLTCMKTELRNCLKADGEALCSVDVRNCQPLLLSYLVGVGTPDARQFRDWAEKGVVYDNIADQVGLTREQVKHSVQLVLFDRPREKCSSCVEKFRDLFPTVFEWLIQHKSKPITDEERREGIIVDWSEYKRPARDLQRLESRIMLETVAAKLKFRQPQSYFGTIHDSVLCHERHVELVTTTIKRAFRSYDLGSAVKVELPSTRLNHLSPHIHCNVSAFSTRVLEASNRP